MGAPDRPDGSSISAMTWYCPLCGQVLPHLVVSKSRLPRASICGKIPAKGAVTIKATGPAGDGHHRAAATGLRQCSKAWICPTCARAKQAGDAETLHACNLGFREDMTAGEVYMLTLTVPHCAGQTLAELRCAVTQAYRETHTGKAEISRRLRFGIMASVRRLEVTWGPNGPHPHIHAMLFCRRKLGDARRAELVRWYVDHWGDAVQAQGYDRPLADCTRLTVADKDGKYLAKMGLLELAGELQKRARCSRCSKMVETHRDGDRTVCNTCGREVNRTQWQILQDWHNYHDRRDRKLWQAYSREIHGARRLTWSRWKGGINLRAEYPTEDPERGEPVPEPGEASTSTAPAPLEVPGRAWFKLSEQKRLDMIEAFEAGDLQACYRMIDGAIPVGWEPGDRKPPPDNHYKLTPEEKAELAWAGFRLGRNGNLTECNRSNEQLAPPVVYCAGEVRAALANVQPSPA
jgi:hypothetical protein